MQINYTNEFAIGIICKLGIEWKMKIVDASVEVFEHWMRCGGELVESTSIQINDMPELAPITYKVHSKEVLLMLKALFIKHAEVLFECLSIEDLYRGYCLESEVPEDMNVPFELSAELQLYYANRLKLELVLEQLQHYIWVME